MNPVLLSRKKITFSSLVSRTEGAFFTKEDFRTHTFGLEDILHHESLEIWTLNKTFPDYCQRIESSWYGACYTFKREQRSEIDYLRFFLKKNFDVVVFMHLPGKVTTINNPLIA
jgi:hypothetical protein